jgi:hypothetical protein
MIMGGSCERHFIVALTQEVSKRSRVIFDQIPTILAFGKIDQAPAILQNSRLSWTQSLGGG